MARLIMEFGFGARLIDALMAQPEIVHQWLGLLVFVNLLVPLIFLPRTEAWVSMLAALVTGSAMVSLFEFYGTVKMIGIAYALVWGPLLLWLWSRWWGVESQIMRLWIVLLALCDAAAIVIGGFEAATFILNR
jgi:hypothetical protein